MPVTDTERALIVAGVAAVASVTVAVITALSVYLASRRDRRRQLFGEAFRCALGWQEMLYRVRRRTSDNEQEIITKFHDLQEQLTYYQGWISSESLYMMRSFRRLVKAVKQGTEADIGKAWVEPVRPVPGNARDSDSHPTFERESAVFLKDVRSHLSPWKFRKIAVWWRNRKDNSAT